MNWDDLKIFLEVVRQPKLERVAYSLRVNATTISRRIKRLETALGATLFERTRRGHILTPKGEELAQQVEAIETVAFDIVGGRASEQSASGRIRIGTPEGVGTAIIASALVDFRKLYPRINVDLIALSGFVSVPKREADMSILLTRPTAGRLKIRRLVDYSLGLYGAQSYLTAARPITSVEDLRHQTLIGYVDELIYSNQLRYFGDLLPNLTPDLCSTSISAQMNMVVNGCGLGILPKFMAAQRGDLINLLCDEIKVERTFWLAVHEDVADLTRNRLMSDFLADTLRALPLL